MSTQSSKRKETLHITESSFDPLSRLDCDGRDLVLVVREHVARLGPLGQVVEV